MNSWRKSLSVLTVSAASVAAAAVGFNVFDHAQLVRAEQPVASERSPSGQGDATKQQISTAQDMSVVFREAAKAVSPSVVSIRVTKTVKNPAISGVPQDRLRRFFHDLNPDMPVPPELNPGEEGDGGGSSQEMGMGSGVIMDSSQGKGYILTNNHVAGDASEMDVTLADGREIKNAKLVGADPKTDLAVVEIQADRLIPAKWGDSAQLQKGDWIMAFGSPFGYIGSMTHGIVSALDRQAGIIAQGQGYEEFIQVDAPINPGNSGGPLVNLRGEVVGINTAIATRSGGFQGIGFAVPSSMARPIYDTLKEKGKIVRGWLGVEIGDVSKLAEEARSVGYTRDNGVLVRGVLKDTPAADKLQPGDVVTTLNGKDIKDVTDLRNRIAMVAPGTEVTLGVFREGKTQDVTVKVGEQPAQLSAVGRPGRGGEDQAAAPTLGMRISDLNSELAQRFGLNVDSGAVVTEVNPGSPAAQSGVRAGDVITRIDNQKVTSAAQAQELLGKADVKKGIRLYITNRGGSQLLVIRPSATK